MRELQIFFSCLTPDHKQNKQGNFKKPLTWTKTKSQFKQEKGSNLIMSGFSLLNIDRINMTEPFSKNNNTIVSKLHLKFAYLTQLSKMANTVVTPNKAKIALFFPKSENTQIKQCLIKVEKRRHVYEKWSMKYSTYVPVSNFF